MAEAHPKRLSIAQRQIDQLHSLLGSIVPNNPFYASKLSEAGAPRRVGHLGQFFTGVPFTTKEELVADQALHPPFGTNLTYPLERYTRCHQTSGTAGSPLRWLDTPESWDWMLKSWAEVMRVAGVTRADRVLFAFSFGPYIGFWLAFETATRLGCFVVAGGGLSSSARLRLMVDHKATVICATPTYAIRLAEVAAEERIDLTASSVRMIIVAGEPGGSIPATRQKIETLWPGAHVFDHHGMTEVGPVSYECPVCPGVLHVMEGAYIAEVINPESGQAVEVGITGELVLTPLGRYGSPLLRYRTGDLVRAALDSVCPCGRYNLALEGGILGRTDDMVVVRGVNVFPSGVEQLVRGMGGVAEYQVQLHTPNGLTEMSVQIEPDPGCADIPQLVQRLETAFQNTLSLRVPVTAVATGSLPRFELKARRWIRQ